MEHPCGRARSALTGAPAAAYRGRAMAVTMPSMNGPQTLDELRSRFAIPDRLRFESIPSGLIRAVVSADRAGAVVYLYGAHVAHYQPHGQAPVLFMSAGSALEPGRPIRGGVPICFPWFGPRAGDPVAPLHGFARTRWWTLDSASAGPDGGVTLEMSLRDDEDTRRIWPHAFALTFRVEVSGRLRMALEVRNPATEPVAFEEALHTYFAVGDARRVAITGLEGASYIDKAAAMTRRQQGGEPVRIRAETDRVYVNTVAPCMIDDPVLGRRIEVAKSGSNTTTVWNPWIAKARAMPDFGDDEWTGMVCVETANAADNAVVLAPGASHEMTQQVTVL